MPEVKGVPGVIQTLKIRSETLLIDMEIGLMQAWESAMLC
jgi:hypothetical protein